MRTLQVLRPSDFAADGGLATMFSRFKAQLMGLPPGKRHARRDLESPVEGQAWTDSLEREFNSGAANDRRLQF